MQPFCNNLIRDAAQYLSQAGIENSRLDVEVLLAHTLSINRNDLILKCGESIISKEEEKEFWKVIYRRKNNEPVAYIVGYKEFYGYSFQVNRHVLIPRPDTETIVETVLGLIPNERSSTVFDICTGSGCIAISVALERPTSQIWATDISAEALKIANRNVQIHGLGERVALFQGDLIEPLSDMRDIDLIVSNPPYIKEAHYDQLQNDVKGYEPKLALVGEGDHALLHHQRLLDMSKSILRSGGHLVMEIGFDQGKEVTELEHSGFLPPEIVIDYGKNIRGAVFQKY